MKKDLWRLWAITFLGFFVFVLTIPGVLYLPREVKSILSFASGFLITILSFFVAKSFTHNYIHHDDAENSRG